MQASVENQDIVRMRSPVKRLAIVGVAIALATGVALAADPDAFVSGTIKDCVECNLAGRDLQDRNFQRAKLDRANLTGANLAGASLFRSTLLHANLSGAKLNGA